MFPPNNHNLQEKPDEHNSKCGTFFSTTPTMQEGFDFSSPPKPKLSKKRKAEDQLIDVHGGGGGGRIVRPTAGKDKHSKVSTARGPRDRRLRLSPKTAIQFYDVQDRLGYDRPSKAIDWLIKEAKSAIDALDHAAENRSPSNDVKPVSGFGNFSLLDPAPSTEIRVGPGQCYNPFHHPGFGPGPEIIMDDTSWEIERLQKVIKAWNCDSGNYQFPGNFNTMEIANLQAQPIVLGNGQILSHREPLQSTIINNYSPISPHFPAVFGYSDGDDQLSSITRASTLEEDGNYENYSRFRQ